MHKNTNDLRAWLKNEKDNYGNTYQLACALGVPHGAVYRVLDGGDSPRLRRALKMPMHERRPRLNIDCPPESIARFDAQRGEMTRGDWLDVLMDLADGIGEVKI